MPIFMWEYSNVKNFWRQYTKIRSLKIRTFLFEKTLPGNAFTTGSVTRQQLGVSDSEQILFLSLSPNYIDGSGFYQGIDVTYRIIATSGTGSDNAVIFKVYNNSTNQFSNVPFIVRGLVM